ncbi:hypothetical protein V6N13_136856 [Hibiscus sabdariffa]
MPFDEISFLLFVGFLCLHFNFRWCFQLFSLLHEGISFSPRKVTLVGHDVNSEADSLVKSGINRCVSICRIVQNMIDDRVVALCRDSLSGSKVFDSVPATLAELVRKETVSF